MEVSVASSNEACMLQLAHTTAGSFLACESNLHPSESGCFQAISTFCRYSASSCSDLGLAGRPGAEWSSIGCCLSFTGASVQS